MSNQTVVAVKASIFPPVAGIDQRLVKAVRLAKKELGCRVFCLIQHHDNDDVNSETISPWLYNRLLASLHRHPKGEKVAVLLHSPGGDPHSTYRIAKTVSVHGRMAS